ncbi:MAG: TraR/DksA family transcriptional regulator [Rhodobacter sp.]|nr:TraR/DksA family transcriptional regulator [Rhodobacter sp.]
MDRDRQEHFRARLLAERAALDADDDLGREGRQTVVLDQQSVGRLNRMDALQRQAMAKATQARRGQARHRIDAALARLDEGDFGYCTECGEEIPHKRLELDPTLPTCVGCAASR